MINFKYKIFFKWSLYKHCQTGCSHPFFYVVHLLLIRKVYIAKKSCSHPFFQGLYGADNCSTYSEQLLLWKSYFRQVANLSHNFFYRHLSFWVGVYISVTGNVAVIQYLILWQMLYLFHGISWNHPLFKWSFQQRHICFFKKL